MRTDDEGVIVIPRHLASTVAEQAAAQEHKERFLLERIRSGSSLVGTYPPDEETQAEYEAAFGWLERAGVLSSSNGATSVDAMLDKIDTRDLGELDAKPAERTLNSWQLASYGAPAMPLSTPVGYFSSLEPLPSTCRATISCWICWVPSKMSMILESRANFSSSSVSA